jgi:hypothetical protein
VVVVICKKDGGMQSVEGFLSLKARHRLSGR